MFALFAWSLGEDSIQETPEQRARIREQLGLNPFLAKREIMTVQNGAVHCELYKYSDTAPTIIFLPGLSTYGELYAHLLSSISAKGFNVVAMDYRGHGYSQGSRGEYRVAQTMDDLKAVVDTVKKQFSGAIGIYGYSMGAMLATAFAERDTRVKSLLCGTLLLTEVPPDFLHQMGWTWLWGSSLFYPNMKLPVGSMLNMQLLMSKIPGEDEVIKNDARLVFDYPIGTLASLFTHRAGVTRKTYPFKAAIIQGEHDEVLSTYYAQRSMQHLTHPFELKVLPKVGHMAPWEDPEMLASEVARWFQATLVES